jgi:hypothetical protein
MSGSTKISLNRFAIPHTIDVIRATERVSALAAQKQEGPTVNATRQRRDINDICIRDYTNPGLYVWRKH